MPLTSFVHGIHSGEIDAKEARQALQAIRAESSLAEFVKLMWHVVEPTTPLLWGAALDAICEHLEAVTDGRINRLLINVPPGFAKSLMTDVFWPAWEWGPKNLPSMRYIAFSYSSMLTKRDNGRFAALITSELYRRFWGDRFALPPMWGDTKVENDKTGKKFATSVQGVGTGERGQRVIIDDPHNIKEGESDTIRAETVRWFAESITTRLNDPVTSAIVVIMQRVHESDVSGHILANDLGYCHLMLPMVFDGRKWVNEIGFEDWREEDGEILFPERFPQHVVDRDQHALGPYAFSGQMQQAPTPRGGGIIKRDWWQEWPPENWPVSKRNHFPPFEFVLGSLDTAFGTNQTNDFSALTIWGVFRDTGDLMAVPFMVGQPSDLLVVPAEEHLKTMLVYGWQKRLELHGEPERKPHDLTDAEWMSPAWRGLRTKGWGVVEWVVDTCRTYQVDHLLIEDKSRGHDVARELQRLYSGQNFSVELVNPGALDKESRMWAIQPHFSNGQVYAPITKAWAQTIIDQVSSFPKGAHDDLADTVSMAIKWLRKTGMALRKDEIEASYSESIRHQAQKQVLYDV